MMFQSFGGKGWLTQVMNEWVTNVFVEQPRLHRACKIWILNYIILNILLTCTSNDFYFAIVFQFCIVVFFLLPVLSLFCQFLSHCFPICQSPKCLFLPSLTKCEDRKTAGSGGSKHHHTLHYTTFNFAICTVSSALWTVHCNLCTVSCTLYIVDYCSLSTVNW